jgi:hypothetical protein
MDRIVVEYRGIAIDYREDEECWYCLLDEKTNKKQTLKECKKKIDEWYKAQVTETPVINMGALRWDKFQNAVVTSIDSAGDVWIRNIDGSREKANKGSRKIAIDSQTNRDKISAYLKQSDFIKQEKKKLDAIYESIEWFHYNL